MTLFLSHYKNKIDRKGRVSVPASFRAVLASSSFAGVVLFPSFRHPAFEGGGMEMMEDLSRRVDQYDLFSDAQDDLSSLLFAQAQALPFDGEGRIALPDRMCTELGLADAICFVGRGKLFQMWHPDALTIHQEATRQRLKTHPQSLPSLKTDFIPHRESA